MIRNSSQMNPEIDANDTNSDDADQFSSETTDDENIPHQNISSFSENRSASIETDFSNVASRSHLMDAAAKTEDWSRSYSVGKSWNYRSVLNDKAQTRLKINLSKVKKVKIKKPRIGIVRRKNDASSLYDSNSLKKRAKYVQSNATKKRLISKNRQKVSASLIQHATVNGVNVDNTSISEPIVNEVPRMSVSSSFAWINHTRNVESVSEDVGTNVGEYAQYLELKPSVKFKCYRCGINDFSTMSTLQEHIATCNGKICNDSVTHSSPVRTIKPLSSTPSASPNLRITRKVFLCSSCGTYYQNYNLYIHMRDKHNKQICLFCRNIFSRSEQLWDHLVTVHKLDSVKYSSVLQIKNAFKSSFYITCCSCNSIFSDDDPFNEHSCENGNDSTVAGVTFCTDCKQSNDFVEISETDPVGVVNDEIFEDSRWESASVIDDEDESKIELQDKFMSRDSTLDFIGVPENHTVTSLPEEIKDTKELESVVENEEVAVQKSSSLSNSDHIDAPNSDQDASSVENHGGHDEQSPMHNGDASVCEAEPFDTKENPVNSSELAYENSNDVSELNELDHPADDTANHDNDSNDDGDVDDECEKSSVSEADDIAKQSTQSIRSPVSETNAPSNCADVHSVDSQDIKSETTVSKEEIESIPPPLAMALMLDETVDSLTVQTLMKECVRTSCLTCLYCNNATRIAVNGSQLAAHLVAEHRFMPTKHEDDSRHVVKKLETGMNDLKNVYMNATFSSHKEITFDGSFACLQCSFSTQLFKDLCHHKRRTHHKVIFLCIMCKCSFQSYSQLLCHLCPATYSTETLYTLSYHCCFCDVDLIPSAFRLMVHLRKMHQACDICLSRHADQSELYSHMIKQHKISHLCYKCNLAWRSRDDINKHLFWKHGTESVSCKRCLQKKWPHAYHFCIPASTYTCDECSRVFTKAVALTVHRRAHNGEFPFPCDLCEHRCISKKLLDIHREDVHRIMREPQPDVGENASVDDSANRRPDETRTNETNGANENDKGRRRKRRKKMKSGDEKPLLDELPPLNLSSESEDESADEETGKTETYSAAVPSCLRDDEQRTEKVGADETETTPRAHVDCTADGDDAIDTAEPAAAPTEAALPEAGSEDKPNVIVTAEPDAVVNADLMEKILNCLIVEHSYCIPDSIFHSEVTNHSAVSESSDNANKQQSPKPCSKRDKSCCKSITPHKRKHVAKRESSSSDTSTDSDSSSSSCGSNCSCNKSASNSSPSSSSSESTTPEKRMVAKKKTRSPSKEKSTADENSANERSLLSIPESDLDTEITTSDEDFYEVHPFFVPPPPPPVETKPEPVITPPVPYENKITIHRETHSAARPSRSERKSKKRKKKPKITINLGSIQRNSGLSKSPFASNVGGSLYSPSNHPVASSSTTYVAQSGTSAAAATAASAYQLTPGSLAYPNCVNSTPALTTTPTSSGGGDSSGRLSKRKRVKNKFYGYSSSDEASGHESLKTTIQLVKRRPPSKKMPKTQSSSSSSRQPFIGIRAKKPFTTTLPVQRYPNGPAAATAAASNATAAYPSLSSPSADMYRLSTPSANDMYRQRSFVKPVVPESSDDSDSDERRHTLVINLPNLKDKKGFGNSLGYRTTTPASSYSNSVGSALSSSSWFASQRTPSHVPPPLSSTSQTTPNKKEIYCFCRCPYDEVSEMIACDGPNCAIEWFHFECVGIMAAPKGQWFCPNCRKNLENVCRSI